MSHIKQKIVKHKGGNSKKGTAQVNPATPKQIVAKKFGTKDTLVDAILGMYDAPEGSRGKLKQCSNSTLMSHHHNTQRMVKQFGTRQGAIDAILKVIYPKDNAPDSVKAKYAGYSPWRLMDLARQHVGN